MEDAITKDTIQIVATEAMAMQEDDERFDRVAVDRASGRIDPKIIAFGYHVAERLHILGSSGTDG